MYLNYLEENEKQAFLQLANAIANADGELCDKEKTIIGYYCNEMNINNFAHDQQKSIDALAMEFKSMRSKKITILELMSIVHANGEFKKEEKMIVDLLVQKFGISQDYLNDVEKWTDLMLSVIEQGNSLIEA